ncbi:MAG: hypothetical protein COT14_03960 [Candidatus Diapherotrites archaeon CG08_land_8_20_14_0_20_30_16]|nr:MAG: hypothetical protein COT14_03960 [Candidatus Diapherotrites archaeon CG08_land_8_20_14_0_20_30_16]
MVFENTKIDDLFGLLVKHKEISLKELSERLNYSIETIEKIGLRFEKQGIVEMVYPVIGNPKIKILKQMYKEKEEEIEGKIFDHYNIVSDHILCHVKLIEAKANKEKEYSLDTAKFKPYTDLFLESLRDEITDKVNLEVTDMMDNQTVSKLKADFFATAKIIFQEYFPEEHQIKIICAEMLHRMYGLGKIEVLLNDPHIEEIALNSSKTEVCIYHKKYGWLKTNILPASEEMIANYSEQVGRKVGREITTLNPILDAHLPGGNRVNATLTPISAFGNTMTIRKFATRPWTVVDFIGQQKTMNTEMAAILWIAMHYELNILVAGGTASGKTSALNAFCAFIPSNNRIISIEDVREIQLPEHLIWNWVPMVTRNPNPEGLGQVSMLDLMQTSLRMRPDRIIVGEIRRQKEAEVLFEAMHTGHSTYSTMHANNSRQVVRRLTEKPLEIPTLEIEAIDLLLVQYRDRRKNLRRTYELSEIETGVSNDQLSINTIYKWSARDDAFDKIAEPAKFIRQLNLYTGMTESEIKTEIKNRARILEWMNNHNLSDISDVGKIMVLFYSNQKLVSNFAKLDKDPKELFE